MTDANPAPFIWLAVALVYSGLIAYIYWSAPGP